jgi:hypothetical protein
MSVFGAGRAAILGPRHGIGLISMPNGFYRKE